MLLLALAACLFASGSETPMHLRVGLHASAHDLSPLLGTELSTEHFGADFDAWIRPGYWKVLEQESATRWVQHKILRYGFVLGAYALVGTPRLGLLPMAGLEFVTGDIAGSAKFPEGEVNPWGGIGVAFAKRARFDVREAVGAGVLGHPRADLVVVF